MKTEYVGHSPPRLWRRAGQQTPPLPLRAVAERFLPPPFGALPPTAPGRPGAAGRGRVAAGAWGAARPVRERGARATPPPPVRPAGRRRAACARARRPQARARPGLAAPPAALPPPKTSILRSPWAGVA